ncbi:MAG: LysR family transcriptional regulator [Synergistaceae bacterium]|nr:LysR family transcriptional regulator [Synergistaceae bacterium]
MENLRYKAFVRSVETGSFTKAASNMSYTPAGVFRLVNAFEDEIGIQLFIRDNTGVRLTKEGSLIYQQVKKVQFQENNLLTLINDIKGITTGEITIGAYSSIAVCWLPSIIKRFNDRFPSVILHIWESANYEELYGWLESNIIDICFFSRGELDQFFDWIPLSDDPLLAILPQSHPYAQSASFPIERFKEEKLIVQSNGNDDLVINILQRHDVLPQITHTTLSSLAALSLVEKGLGVCLMNKLFIQKQSFNVQAIPLLPPQFITMGIAVTNLETASPSVRKFIQVARETLHAEKVEGI